LKTAFAKDASLKAANGELVWHGCDTARHRTTHRHTAQPRVAQRCPDGQGRAPKVRRRADRVEMMAVTLGIPTHASEVRLSKDENYDERRRSNARRQARNANDVRIPDFGRGSSACREGLEFAVEGERVQLGDGRLGRRGRTLLVGVAPGLDRPGQRAGVDLALGDGRSARATARAWAQARENGSPRRRAASRSARNRSRRASERMSDGIARDGPTTGRRTAGKEEPRPAARGRGYARGP
jgi:hypothetical protein